MCVCVCVWINHKLLYTHIYIYILDVGLCFLPYTSPLILPALVCQWQLETEQMLLVKNHLEFWPYLNLYTWYHVFAGNEASDSDSDSEWESGVLFVEKHGLLFC